MLATVSLAREERCFNNLFHSICKVFPVKKNQLWVVENTKETYPHAADDMRMIDLKITQHDAEHMCVLDALYGKNRKEDRFVECVWTSHGCARVSECYVADFSADVPSVHKEFPSLNDLLMLGTCMVFFVD